MSERPARMVFEGPQAPPLRVAIVAAHPDDEVIGASAVLLRHGAHARVVHVTDGAPRNLSDARALGFPTRDAYAAARRAELADALSRAGIGSERCVQLGGVDQEASGHLVAIVRLLEGLLTSSPVDVVVTHPYEGGHPDHDATAFAVHAVLAELVRTGRSCPRLVEMTSYHAGPSGMRTGVFLSPRTPATIVRLTAAERAAKRTMLDRFVSQHRVLASFTVGCERFREAPAYRFDRPPHAGRLFYEQFDWAMDGARWRALAAEAARALEWELACRSPF